MCDKQISETESGQSLSLITCPELLPLVCFPPLPDHFGGKSKVCSILHSSSSQKNVYLSSDSDSDSDLDKDIFNLAKTADYCCLTPVKPGTIVHAAPAWIIRCNKDSSGFFTQTQLLFI